MTNPTHFASSDHLTPAHLRRLVRDRQWPRAVRALAAASAVIDNRLEHLLRGRGDEYDHEHHVSEAMLAARRAAYAILFDAPCRSTSGAAA